MNIVEINQTYKRGSTGNIVNKIVERANDMGIKSLVCCSEKVIHQDTEYNKIYTIGSFFDHKVHAVLSRITGKQGYFSYISTKKMIKQIKIFKPDLIHLYINLKLLFDYINEESIPTVISLHDCWFFTGKCVHIRDCEKWKCNCGKCPYLRIDNVNPTLLFDRTTECLSNKEKWFSQIKQLYVVGVSKWIINCSKNSILKKAKHKVIYNGVDVEIFKQTDSDIRQKNRCENKFVILMVSNNISKVKGYNEMLYLSTLNQEEFQVIVIGKNPNNLKIPNNVIHIEHTESQIELAKFYSAADVCVNTTQHETFGLVTAEAMACGTPVIVYNNTASPELVGEGCGVVISKDDKYANLKDAIYLIKKQSKEFFSVNCRNYAEKMFSCNQMVDSYIDLYQKIVEEKKCVYKKSGS